MTSGAEQDRGLRALLLAADVGESHVAMARTLAADLLAREEFEAAEVVADFSSLGPRLERVLGGGYRLHVGRVQWTYDLAYRLFTGLRPAQRLGELALERLGGNALLETVRAHRPDVVVSTHPVINPVLAGLRASGRLGCPAAAVVGPLGGLGFWVQPRLDEHLFHYAEAIEHARRALKGTPAVAVRPLVCEEFFAPLPRAQARRALGIEGEEPLVLISGGGWGAGDVAGAIGACLVADPSARVLAVVGRNNAMQARLEHRHEDDPRVSVLGFTERMRDLLCAADAFVTATAGISCLEARLCGCPTICYGFAIGHVRDNIRALADHGFARAARTLRQLTAEVQGALAGGRRPIPPLAELPRAAERVSVLANRERDQRVRVGSHRSCQPSPSPS